MKTSYLIRLAAPTLLMSGVASGQNLITNGSFETVVGSYDHYNSTGSNLWGTGYDLAGWSGENMAGNQTDVAAGWDWAGLLNPQGDEYPFGGGWQSNDEGLNSSSTSGLGDIVTDGADGFRFAVIGNSPGSLTQSIATVVGEQYVLTGVIGMPEDDEIDPINGAIGGVYIGGQLAGSATEADWGTFSYTYTATSTNTLIELTYVQGDNANATEAMVVDNLVLPASVPEPSVLLLGVLGVAGCATRRVRS